MTETKDILEVVEIYLKRVEEFKREMEALGVKVKVMASSGSWHSVVEEVEERDE